MLVAKALIKGGWGVAPVGRVFPALTRLSSALPISAVKAGKVPTKEHRDDGAGFSLPRRGLCFSRSIYGDSFSCSMKSSAFPLFLSERFLYNSIIFISSGASGVSAL